jgi:hypothetical protein
VGAAYEEVLKMPSSPDRLPSRYGDALEWKYIEGATRRRRWTRIGIGAAIAATLRLDGGTRMRIESPTAATLERGAIYFSSEGHAGVTIEAAAAASGVETRIEGTTLVVEGRR